MVCKKCLLGMNTVAFFAMIAVNALANALPIAGRSTGYISNLYPNLFTPAGFTFSIWGVIYLLLGVHLGYQILDLSRGGDRWKSAIDAYGYLFLISSILNIAWLFAWHNLMIPLSLVIMVGLLSTLIAMHRRLNPSGTVDFKKNWKNNLPFSVYLGWISVATIANVTVFLVDVGWDGFGLSDVFWTTGVLVVATLLAVIYSVIRRDAPYSLVVLWAFIGIISKRLSVEPAATTVIVAAGAGGAVIIISLLWMIMRTRSRPSEVTG